MYIGHCYREEARERVKDLPNIKMRFVSYYKYEFTYVGYTSNGYKISLVVGGFGDEVYRSDLTFEMYLSDILNEADANELEVKERN